MMNKSKATKQRQNWSEYNVEKQGRETNKLGALFFSIAKVEEIKFFLNDYKEN